MLSKGGRVLQQAGFDMGYTQAAEQSHTVAEYDRGGESEAH